MSSATRCRIGNVVSAGNRRFLAQLYENYPTIPVPPWAQWGVWFSEPQRVAFSQMTPASRAAARGFDTEAGVKGQIGPSWITGGQYPRNLRQRLALEWLPWSPTCGMTFANRVFLWGLWGLANLHSARIIKCGHLHRSRKGLRSKGLRMLWGVFP